MKSLREVYDHLFSIPWPEDDSNGVLFFLFDFRFSASRGRFTPAEARNRPCASQNEITYSPRGTQVKNSLFHRRSSYYCSLAKI